MTGVQTCALPIWPQNQENNLHFTSTVLRIDFAPVEVSKLALHSTSYTDKRIFMNEIKKITYILFKFH